jgi:monoamine oxidase
LPWLDEKVVDDVVIADWGADPFSRGGYSYPAVGALDAPGVWATSVENTLFFAGEATCGDEHPATVHGAYDSGLRAAEEVLEALEAA